MKVRPTGKRILIKKTEPEKYIPGTKLLIPESAKKDDYRGLVIAVGNEVKEVKEGEIIQYAQYAVPTEMMHNGEKHLIVNEGDVFAVIEK